MTVDTPLATHHSPLAIELTISLVVAATENSVIGKDNKLLWHLPNDLRFFKNTTWAMPVIMGRKTFESVKTPLRGRTNIVVTKQNDWGKDKVKIAHTLEDALKVAAETDAKEAFVIGGGQIFEQSMHLAHKIYMTRIHAILEGDTFFPDIPESHWQLHSNLDFPADKKHAYSYSFQVWVRK